MDIFEVKQFKIIVIRHCVVALPKYVEAILVTSATMMIFTVLVYAKEEDNQGFTNYVCFKCHNLSIPKGIFKEFVKRLSSHPLS